jgi:3-oxoadipate enol-lactonase
VSVELGFEASGPTDAPPVLLGSSVGTTHHMWDRQVDVLAERWRVVAFDTRGHGGSPVTDGPLTVPDLAGDVLALADSLGLSTFGYCGLSLGGAIGQVLAARHPDRVRALVLCCTSARFADGADSWLERAARVRSEGMEWLVEPSTARWFTDGFPGREPDEAARLLDMLRQMSPDGYAAACEALATFDGRPLLGDIAAPTLVVAGEEDPATPVQMSEEIAAGVAGAELTVVRHASHLAAVERPDVVTDAIARHLERHLR